MSDDNKTDRRFEKLIDEARRRVDADSDTNADPLTIELDRSEGHYQLKGEIARGGMGAVLRVWDKSLHRFVAMKVVLGQAEIDSSGSTPPVHPEMISRFIAEAQITGQLDHPGIVPVHELGTDEQGRAFFTMQIVKGHTLAEVFKLAERGEQGWTTRRVLDVFLRVCEAVAYAHDKQVIHRDLKPSNVMVGEYGKVYVMDWGIAKVLGEPDRHDIRLQVDATSERQPPGGDDDTAPIRTMDGHVIGTPAYMAPEQARGETESIRAQTDIYSIGATLYHYLAGHPPYIEPGISINARQVLTRVIEGPPRALTNLDRDVPPELAKIADKAMARDPDRRYRNLLELVDDLRSYLDRGVIGARQSLRSSRSTRALNNVLTIGLWACGLIFAIGVCFPSAFALSVNVPVHLDEAIAVDSVPNWTGDMTLENVYANLTLPASSIAFQLALLLCILWSFCLIYLMRSVVRTARDGQPFDPQNMRRIRLVGMSVFAIGVFQVFLEPVIHLYVFHHVKVTGGQLGHGLYIFDPINAWMLIGVAILLLAEVFRVGTELEKAR